MPTVYPENASLKDITFQTNDGEVTVSKNSNKVIITPKQLTSQYTTNYITAKADGVTAQLVVMEINKSTFQKMFSETRDDYGAFGMKFDLYPSTFANTSKFLGEYGLNLRLASKPVETAICGEDAYNVNINYKKMTFYYKDNTESAYEIVETVDLMSVVTDYNNTDATATHKLTMHNSKKTDYKFLASADYLVSDANNDQSCTNTINPDPYPDKKTNDYIYILNYGPYKYGSTGKNSYFNCFSLEKYYYRSNGVVGLRQIVFIQPNKCYWQGATTVTIGSPRDSNRQDVRLTVVNQKQ